VDGRDGLSNPSQPRCPHAYWFGHFSPISFYLILKRWLAPFAISPPRIWNISGFSESIQVPVARYRFTRSHLFENIYKQDPQAICQVQHYFSIEYHAAYPCRMLSVVFGRSYRGYSQLRAIESIPSGLDRSIIAQQSKCHCFSSFQRVLPTFLATALRPGCRQFQYAKASWPFLLEPSDRTSFLSTRFQRNPSIPRFPCFTSAGFMYTYSL
jgi:hypothetical protein